MRIFKNAILPILCTILMIANAQSVKSLTGTASFYAEKFNGRKTATGETFSNKAMTCACNQLKLGTMVRVTNLKNNKSVVLIVNDRLAASNHRVVDVSAAAAKQLGFFESGLGRVKVEVIEKKSQNQSEEKNEQVDSTQNQKKDSIFNPLESK
jgi:rare lipoprotein A